MIKLVTIIGARPQIIKASAMSRVIKSYFSNGIDEIIIHTGQHYDYNMSEVFFNEMQIPRPFVNLDIKSGSHGGQTAAMLQGLEEILVKTAPDAVMLYGDTNSTLAGSLAASKLFIPVIHIEAGLRSYNKSMPEEINRIVCDHVSTLLFSPTLTGVNNLIKEGFNPGNKPPYTIDNQKVYHCGDVMYDNTLFFSRIAEQKSSIIKDLKLSPEKYILATIHRPNNTDEPERLASLFSALVEITEKYRIPVVLPLHPRTQKLMPEKMDTFFYRQIQNNPLIQITEPVSFLDMILLEKNSRIIITDSGGVQKESYFMKKPSIVLRPETEWVEIAENGAAVIADADKSKITGAFDHFMKTTELTFPPVFGDGHAAEFICTEILKHIIN